MHTAAQKQPFLSLIAPRALLHWLEPRQASETSTMPPRVVSETSADGAARLLHALLANQQRLVTHLDVLATVRHIPISMCELCSDRVGR